jgi:serine/threonine protein kinase
VEEISNRHVHIRTFPTVLSRFPLLQEQLQSTYNKLSKIHCKSILPIIRINTKGGQPYVVFPYVDAGSLGDRFRSGFYSALDVGQIVNDIAVSLEYAHRHALIHGNLTPDHVLIDDDGSVHVIGFGEAAILRALPSSGGKSAYRFEGSGPPEADNASKLSPATDQYSLALIALRLFTGIPVDEALDALKDDVAEIQRHKGRERSLTLPLSPQILEALNRALSEKPSKRYPSISEFKHALLAGFGVVGQPRIEHSVQNVHSAQIEPIERHESVVEYGLAQQRTHSRQPEQILKEQAPKKKKRAFFIASLLVSVIVFGIAITAGVATWIDSDGRESTTESVVVGTDGIISLPEESLGNNNLSESASLVKDSTTPGPSQSNEIGENGTPSPTPTAGDPGGGLPPSTQASSTTLPHPIPTSTISPSNTDTPTPDLSSTPTTTGTPGPSATPTPTSPSPTDTLEPTSTPTQTPPPTNTDSPTPIPTIRPKSCKSNPGHDRYCTPTPSS